MLDSFFFFCPACGIKLKYKHLMQKWQHLMTELSLAWRQKKPVTVRGYETASEAATALYSFALSKLCITRFYTWIMI